jgi:predicted RNase H-like HicB family nuclease
MRQVLIYSVEAGYWLAECPSLPGCVSQGSSQQDAIFNIKEAIQLYIETFEKDHLPVPEEHFDAILVVV